LSQITLCYGLLHVRRNVGEEISLGLRTRKEHRGIAAVLF